MLVKIGSFPQVRDENKKIFETTTQVSYDLAFQRKPWVA